MARQLNGHNNGFLIPNYWFNSSTGCQIIERVFVIDLEHENAVIIKQWFIDNNLELSIDDKTVFKIYKDISYYGRIVVSESFTDRLDVYKMQSSFIKKNILGLMYKENNNSARGIKQGYVYAMHNKSWNEYVKIGCTIDVYDRLNTYQSYSPFRDYELIGYVYSEDKFKLEKEIHNKFERNGEWIKSDKSTIKRFLKDHEYFDLNEISKFSFIEICRTIGKSEVVSKQVSNRNKIKMFLKHLKSKIKSRYDFMDNIDLDSRSCIICKNEVWQLVGTPLFMRVVDNVVTTV